MRKNSTADDDAGAPLDRGDARLPRARPHEQDEPGDQVADAGGRQRRDGLDGELDGEIRRAPDDVDGEECQDEAKVQLRHGCTTLCAMLLG